MIVQNHLILTSIFNKALADNHTLLSCPFTFSGAYNSKSRVRRSVGNSYFRQRGGLLRLFAPCNSGSKSSLPAGNNLSQVVFESTLNLGNITVTLASLDRNFASTREKARLD